MTSLFFIMLTLFVLVIVLLHQRMQVTQQRLDEIEKVVNSTKELEGDYFSYRDKYKKYVLDVDCFFPEKRYMLSDLQADTVKLRQAGNVIKNFLVRHSAQENKYLLIIEGQASRNSVEWTDRNYDWSFQRALTLMKFWKDVCHIDFGANCEIQIAGSGDGRYNIGYTAGENTERFRILDATLMREHGANEKLNQRFIIHIIPKNILRNDATE